MVFTPKKIDKYNMSFAVRLEHCYKCKKGMVSKPAEQYSIMSTFSGNSRDSFESQANRAGLVFQSGVLVDGNRICTECAEAGGADFLCALCGDRHLLAEECESFGYPKSFLCNTCYGITPAKVWDEKIDELTKKHRYDFG